jgi:tRNA-specific 2-thiouridylase
MGENKPTVVVAMSGGVDSSVAAALLAERGYNVVGMMMRLWSEPSVAESNIHNRCCTPDQMADARRIAAQLNIPFYVIDTKDYFHQQVVQFFIEQHKQGFTPNPCMACNRHIRFEWLLNHARSIGADYLATGHYARITQSDDDTYQLRKGLSENKDQSYVLSVLTQKKLSQAMFPIGEFTKPEVRQMATDFGLNVASKQDSQDLCFLGDGDYRRFLREHGGEEMFKAGPILMSDGTPMGEHHGLPNYTIGQRKGLNISYSEPLYVLKMDHARNALIIGTRNELGRDVLTANGVNWIAGEAPTEPLCAEVKIRYKARLASATVFPLENNRVRVEFDDPLRDITPGQGAVFYQDDICLGGGIIERHETVDFAGKNMQSVRQ